MKRLIVLAGLVLALGLGFWAGCGKSDNKKADGGAAAQPLVIWWAQWAPADGLAELGKEYEKETGTPVKVTQIPWTDYYNQVTLNFGNKTTDFDIVIGDSQWIGLGATKGLYVELTDWLPKNVKMDKVSDRAAKYLCEYPPGSKKFFAAPCETDAVGFVYRKDWFAQEAASFKASTGKELVPPETWEDFALIAKHFTKPEKNQYGCALLTGRGYDSLVMGYQNFMWAWGADWADRQTFKVDGTLNTPQAAEGLAFMKELMKYSPPGGNDFGYDKMSDMVINGSAAMAMNYFAFFPDISRKMGDKVGFFMVPGHNGKRGVSLGGQGFSISKKISAQRQDEAKKFIAWFNRTEIQKKWITKDAGFTADVDILNSDEFKKASPYNAAFSDSIKCVQDFWNVPQFNELLAVAQQHLGEAIDGKAQPLDALNKIAQEHEKILKEAGLLK